MARYFIGIEPSDEARRGIGNVVKRLKRGHFKIAHTPEERWHLTLIYLGEVSEEQRLVEFFESLFLNSFAQFVLRFKGLGSFPDLVWPRVIWMAVVGDLKALHRVRKMMRESLVLAGYWYDDRKSFVPHVTLGKVQRDCGRAERLELGSYLSKNRILDIPQVWEVGSICLYRSDVVGGEVQYQILGRLQLGYDD